ncbi:DUF1294 domain-containing protein [[Clostridium] fimetarium]|uniref:Uncharacterized membrane protein YsdA, DUF1294 family n=1 Tax=[Clostridium] fimetarium TaxID=99656 RepID=A0A1I0QD83_9FIRM|nr:DUF1294 domain-containing protein [[Clostridium] fimetarium]SEW24854.1 Uncharacterized membrane protein YsdA, DUF1294 family [[Clostridium] fimetarium]
MVYVVVGYLVIINVIAFVVYGIDKRKAKKHLWRIPEATLIGLALMGGSVGAFLGMRCFRHKTKHIKFYVGVPAIFMIEIAIAIFLKVKF